jgi:hypothetical protein
MLSPSYDEDMEDDKDIQKDTGWSLQRYEMVCAEIAASLFRCFVASSREIVYAIMISII